jgi:hypothetical protein
MSCGMLNNNKHSLKKEADCLGRKLLPWKVLLLFYFFPVGVCLRGRQVVTTKGKSVTVFWPAIVSRSVDSTLARSI